MIAAILALALAQEEPPDNSWGAWWPAAQWSRKSEPPDDASVKAARRTWERVDFPRIETPWGSPSVSLSTLEMKAPYPERRCLRFDLVFQGPGTVDEEAWKKHPVPPKGAVVADILSRGKVVRASLNVPAITGWVGGGLGSSGDMLIEFDFLPDDLEDYWVRIKIAERTVWFLIPYGFGSDPLKPLSAVRGAEGPPRAPEGRGEKDQVVAWSAVDVDLGWTDAAWKIRSDMPKELKDVWEWTRDKRNVDLRMSNPFDGAGRLSLYKEDLNAPWTLNNPRTTLAIGIPGKRVLFSTLKSVEKGEDPFRRSDSFNLWRQPSDTRTWGLLRVTVEETAFELAVPGSLFLYTHGAPR
ncbi:MAG TPA: hypothetical protein VF950_16925 [Planctomycetota bacterium]